jgi:hypothetical protein
MAQITATVLKDACIIKSEARASQPPWQYPLQEKLGINFSYEAAQSLLELSYRVTVHNGEVFRMEKDPLQLNPPNFDVVIPIDETYMLLKVNVMWFFYSAKLNMVVVVATGTYNPILALVDLEYAQKVPTLQNSIDGMKVHGGFWDFYHNVQYALWALFEKYVNADTQIVLTGLSLGGAISSIALLDTFNRKLNNGVTIKNAVHYSFASPRLFNTVGAKHYRALDLPSFQIHNGSDIIPVVPLPIMPTSFSTTEDFMHVGSMIYFDENLGDYHANHITAYLQKYHITPLN